MQHFNCSVRDFLSPLKNGTAFPFQSKKIEWAYVSSLDSNTQTFNRRVKDLLRVKSSILSFEMVNIDGGLLLPTKFLENVRLELFHGFDEIWFYDVNLWCNFLTQTANLKERPPHIIAPAKPPKYEHKDFVFAIGDGEGLNVVDTGKFDVITNWIKSKKDDNE